MHRLVVAIVSLIALTGAIFLGAYLLLFSASTDRAATLAPASTLVYANLYLQPSAGQQMNLQGLIGRFPGFADEASLDEKIDTAVQNLLSATGVDYREDVKPWLGDQVAVAGWPSESDPTVPHTVAIVAVKDIEAARSSIAEVVDAQGVDLREETHAGTVMHLGREGAYAFVDDMLVVADGADALRAVIDTAAGAADLAGRADFRATMDRLPDDHLATIFADLAGIADAMDTAAQLEGYSTAGAALVAETDGLRLSGGAPYDREAVVSASAEVAIADEPSVLLEWMPQETVAEVVIFRLAQSLADVEAAASGTPEGEQLTGALDTIRAVAAFGLGIDIDADILPLLDREAAVAFTGMDGDRPTGQLLLRPEDPDAAADALARVTERLAAVGTSSRTEEIGGAQVTMLTIPEAGEVAYTIVDGIVILGLGVDDVAAAIEANADGSSLATSDAYQRTFELAGGRAGTELYVDISALIELLGAAAELPSDARDILGQIGTFGITAPTRDDQIEFHAVLTIEEASGR